MSFFNVCKNLINSRLHTNNYNTKKTFEKKSPL